MVYLFPNNDTFTIFYYKSALHERYHKQLIELESLPEGEGILRRADDGSFYYEPFDTPIGPEQPIPTETLAEKITRLEKKIEQINLISTDINLTIYEEILQLRDEIAALKAV